MESRFLNMLHKKRDKTGKNEFDGQYIKTCPFCGSRVKYTTLVTGMKMFFCNNYKECGAVVSFNTPECNVTQKDFEGIKAWNRRY